MGPSHDHWRDCTKTLHVLYVLSPVPYSGGCEIVPPVKANFTCPYQKRKDLHLKNIFFANELHIVLTLQYLTLQAENDVTIIELCFMKIQLL